MHGRCHEIRAEFRTEETHHANLAVDGRRLPKWMLQKQLRKMWSGLNWHAVRSTGAAWLFKVSEDLLER
jgi:hypothetical protein